MNIDLGSLGSHLAKLAWVALRSFVGTVLVATLAGVVLAALSYYFLREHHCLYGAIAFVVALIESVAAAFFLGAKRAVARAGAYAFGTLRLGRPMVGLIFERMLGVTKGQEPGERGGRVTRALERVPLNQADGLLTSVVERLPGGAEQTGWLRRKIQARLLEGVRKYTLARFRAEDTSHGGVDLLLVKEELERTVDDALVEKVRGGLRFWTVLLIIALPLVVAAQTWVLSMLPPP